MKSRTVSPIHCATSDDYQIHSCPSTYTCHHLQTASFTRHKLSSQQRNVPVLSTSVSLCSRQFRLPFNSSRHWVFRVLPITEPIGRMSRSLFSGPISSTISNRQTISWEEVIRSHLPWQGYHAQHL